MVRRIDGRPRFVEQMVEAALGDGRHRIAPRLAAVGRSVEGDRRPRVPARVIEIENLAEVEGVCVSTIDARVATQEVKGSRSGIDGANVGERGSAVGRIGRTR